MHHSQNALHPDTPIIVLSSIFKKYDTDSNGDLDFDEFCQALFDLGVNDETTQKALFHLTDADNGGTIGIDEFIQLVKANEFDSILSDQKQLEFIYQTHLHFQSIDADKNGERFVNSFLHFFKKRTQQKYTVSWDEFYFYLIKEGYSHKQISDHWHFLNIDKDSKVTFDEFWRGYKAMAKNICNDEDDKKEKEKEQNDKKKPKRSKSKVIEVPIDVIFNHQNDEKTLSAIKEKLKKSSHKMNESEFKIKVGKVVENKSCDDQKEEEETT